MGERKAQEGTKKATALEAEEERAINEASEEEPMEDNLGPQGASQALGGPTSKKTLVTDPKPSRRFNMSSGHSLQGAARKDEENPRKLRA